MSDANDRVVVQCSCGAKFRVPANAIGKKGKCPKCGEAFLVEPVGSSPAGSLMDDLAQQEQSAEAFAAPSHDAQYDHADKTATNAHVEASTGNPAVGAAKSAGTFLLGFMLSAIGAAIGGAAWYFVAYYANVEVGYIAVGVGILAGIGMRLGYRTENTGAGVVASALAVLGIVGAKFVIFSMILSAQGPSDDPAKQRIFVKGKLTEEIMTEQGVKGERGLEEKWTKAYEEATQRVKAMSDEEVRQLYRQQQQGNSAGNNAEDDEDSNALLSFFFSGTFNFFDILWFALAIGSAFKISSAGTES
ncbi:MAG: zinc-ribbon domain-containing protein [Phycisphaerales bacterium]|nr:zinc-ribbon domain-containing protein [Phycisphaerales bacterium]